MSAVTHVYSGCCSVLMVVLEGVERRNQSRHVSGNVMLQTETDFFPFPC